MLVTHRDVVFEIARDVESRDGEGLAGHRESQRSPEVARARPEADAHGGAVVVVRCEIQVAVAIEVGQGHTPRAVAHGLGRAGGECSVSVAQKNGHIVGLGVGHDEVDGRTRIEASCRQRQGAQSHRDGRRPTEPAGPIAQEDVDRVADKSCGGHVGGPVTVEVCGDNRRGERTRIEVD